jgi:hypothetical protein
VGQFQDNSNLLAANIQNYQLNKEWWNLFNFVFMEALELAPMEAPMNATRANPRAYKNSKKLRKVSNLPKVG